MMNKMNLAKTIFDKMPERQEFDFIVHLNTPQSYGFLIYCDEIGCEIKAKTSKNVLLAGKKQQIRELMAMPQVQQISLTQQSFYD